MHAWKVTSVAILFFVSLGCGGGGESALEKSLPPPTKKLSELKASKPEMSKEELAAARKAAGFKSRDEIAAENAAMFEGEAKQYIKRRAEDYRGLIGDMKTSLDGLEKEAGKWPGAKDPQKAFDKFAEGYKEATKELTKRYDEVTGNRAEGGAMQAEFGKAFRAWENLNNDLNPEISSQERFASTLKEIRDGFDGVLETVDEIEKDESVKVPEAEAGDEKKE